MANCISNMGIGPITILDIQRQEMAGSALVGLSVDGAGEDYYTQTCISNQPLPGLATTPDEQGLTSLWDDYTFGVDLAHENNYSEAKTLWENALTLAITSEETVFILENLCWLALYFKDWAYLDASVDFLLQADESNPFGLYAKALMAYREHNYQEAQEILFLIVDQDLPRSPLLTEEINQLAANIIHKTKGNEPYADATTPLPLTRDEVESYTSSTSYLTLQAEPLAQSLLRGRSIQNYLAFEDMMRGFKKTLSDLDVVFLMHLYFRSCMDYQVVRDTSRSLDQAFAQKKYDCTEYANALCRCLTALGIKSVTVTYADGFEGKHSFVAFQIGDYWGYASPLSYEPPRFADLSRVCEDWLWDVADIEDDVTGEVTAQPFTLLEWNPKNARFQYKATL